MRGYLKTDTAKARRPRRRRHHGGRGSCLFENSSSTSSGSTSASEKPILDFQGRHPLFLSSASASLSQPFGLPSRFFPQHLHLLYHRAILFFYPVTALLLSRSVPPPLFCRRRSFPVYLSEPLFIVLFFTARRRKARSRRKMKCTRKLEMQRDGTAQA